MRPYHIVISCEHAGNQVPHAYQYLFRENEKVLASHRGYDIGALEIAQQLSDGLRAKLFITEITRLLVDCNRSVHNAEVFSEFSKPLKKSLKEYLIDHYYLPHREKVERYLINHMRKTPILHLSVHSFTPVLNGVERLVDVGLLFDERKVNELQFCSQWKEQLNRLLPEKNVMLNVPYNGADDGFTTYLRTKYDSGNYLGIELEINQKYHNTAELTTIVDALIASIDSAFQCLDDHQLLNIS